ncbi:MAG: hypothetical protein GF364_22800 [Candidatus Lokiarchaeota archaeon]|nr:hypothetical protein [Candidatus Lokiarchaeota archaeon]
MSDRSRGGLGQGQRIIEVIDAIQELVAAAWSFAALAIIAALRVATILLIAVTLGPWSLVVGAILAGRAVIAAVARWAQPWVPDPDAERRVARNGQEAASIRLIRNDLEADDINWSWPVLLALGFLAALVWLPEIVWFWPVSRETAWGLWWPPVLGDFRASVLLVRLALSAILLRVYPEFWHPEQRFRREIHAPTHSGLAYEKADAGDVDIPGVYNPHAKRDTEPARRERRRIPVNGGDVARAVANGVMRGGNGRNAASVEPERHVEMHEDGYVPFPLSWFAGGRQGAKDWARWALEDSANVSANATGKAGFMSDHRARDLFGWLRDVGAVRLTSANHPKLTPMGDWLLSMVAAGEAQEWTPPEGQRHPLPDGMRG